MAISKWAAKWHSYKYRFLPWLILNFKKRSVRRDAPAPSDATTHGAAVQSILHVLTLLDQQLNKEDDQQTQHEKASQVLYAALGFRLHRRQSGVPAAGRGVFVAAGRARAGAVVCWYPGAVYLPGDPLLLTSIGNPYIFGCADGRYVDGRGGGLSGLMYGSCAGRDRMGPHPGADATWRSEAPVNPLAIGQFVNNHSREHSCNVRYMEVDLPPVPYPLRRYLPYVSYRPCTADVPGTTLRGVVLVAQRDIVAGEELFSEYFTVQTES